MPRLPRFQLSLMIGAGVLLLPRGSLSAQAPLLEVEKGEVKLMQVNDDGGLVARGTDQGAIPASGIGIRMMWFPARYAFRAGVVEGPAWDLANIGFGSLATGINTTARGDYSTALGATNTASAYGATALGNSTSASGEVATAMGNGTVASGEASTAMGLNTVASASASTAIGQGSRASGARSTAIGTNAEATGPEALAMGRLTKAVGVISTAMGFRTTAAAERSTVMGSDAGTLPGATGSFVYGDASTTTALVSFTPNEFVVRASGGFRLRTNSTLSTGCDLPNGSGTFNCTSSRLAKEGFENLDGEVVLSKLATVPIQRWRYRGTSSSHVGPTAEDFYAAFALGEGSQTISTVDADGISLLAVQALERRTGELREENAALRTKLAEDTAALQIELEALRRLVENGRDDK